MWAAEWRRASPLSELSFTQELPSSAALQTSSASSVCQSTRLFMNPPPLLGTLTSQHPLLFKYYGPSGTITRTFRSNGCSAVLSASFSCCIPPCLSRCDIGLTCFLLSINLMIIVQPIKRVYLLEPKFISSKLISYFLRTVKQPNIWAGVQLRTERLLGLA